MGGNRVLAGLLARTDTRRRGAGLALRRNDSFATVSLDSGLGMDVSRVRIAPRVQTGGSGWALAVPTREFQIGI